MGELAYLAEALRYPAPGRDAALRAGLREWPDSPGKAAMVAFVARLQSLSLAEWEELYTRTLDLDPVIAPYIGFQTWGESYTRGNFMARLSRCMVEAGVEWEGELPDHLVPVLRYLDISPNPAADLVEHVLPAIQKMEALLRKADAGNPYLYLLKAARAAIEKKLAALAGTGPVGTSAAKPTPLNT
jgi:nitrate reductase delta subunit